jgi:hypothetical protein
MTDLLTAALYFLVSPLITCLAIVVGWDLFRDLVAE